jgi:hypothetical protein
MYDKGGGGGGGGGVNHARTARGTKRRGYGHSGCGEEEEKRKVKEERRGENEEGPWRKGSEWEDSEGVWR